MPVIKENYPVLFVFISKEKNHENISHKFDKSYSRSVISTKFFRTGEFIDIPDAGCA